MIRSTTLAALLLLATPLLAQRAATTLKLQKRSSTMTYGAPVLIGKLGLAVNHVVSANGIALRPRELHRSLDGR